MYGSHRSQNQRGGFAPAQPLINSSVFAVFMVGMNVCFGVAAIAAVYLLLALFTGHLGDFNTLKSAADKARILSNLGTASTVLLWSAALGALCAGVAFLTEEAAGYLLLLGAIVVGVGAPMALTGFGGESFAPAKSQALRVALGAFPAAMIFPAVIAGLMIARDVVMRLIAVFQPKERYISLEEMTYGGGAKRAPVASKSRPSTLPGKCWTGTYCRENIKTQCPVFHSKTPCWKLGRGCYCEESIVAEAASRISGTHLPMAGSATRFNFSHDSTRQIGGEAPRIKQELTTAQKRARCRSCVIYNEHQQHKYNLLMPVTIAATVFVCFVGFAVMRGQMTHVFTTTLSLVDQFSFLPGSGTGHKAQINEASASPFVMWPMMVAFGIMALAKTLQALEWALFKLKI